jgi:hypothetical protein
VTNGLTADGLETAADLTQQLDADARQVFTRSLGASWKSTKQGRSLRAQGPASMKAFSEKMKASGFVEAAPKRHGIDGAALAAPGKPLGEPECYCGQGEVENRIKEAQLGLFATRTSCQYFDADQFRILLSALAYTLVERLRTLAHKGTPLAKAQIHTLRNQLLKLAAVIIKNTRRIRLYFASHWPSASILQTALHALNSG